MVENGHNANAIAHAKYSVWVKKLKFLKTSENPLYKHITVVLCKEGLQKTANIGKMRTF